MLLEAAAQIRLKGNTGDREHFWNKVVDLLKRRKSETKAFGTQLPKPLKILKALAAASGVVAMMAPGVSQALLSLDSSFRSFIEVLQYQTATRQAVVEKYVQYFKATSAPSFQLTADDLQNCNGQLWKSGGERPRIRNIYNVDATFKRHYDAIENTRRIVSLYIAAYDKKRESAPDRIQKHQMAVGSIVSAAGTTNKQFRTAEALSPLVEKLRNGAVKEIDDGLDNLGASCNKLNSDGYDKAKALMEGGRPFLGPGAMRRIGNKAGMVDDIVDAFLRTRFAE